MSIPSFLTPFTARMSHIASTLSGAKHSEELIIKTASIVAQKTLKASPWVESIDKEIHASLFESALHVAKGTFRLSYEDLPAPEGLFMDEKMAYWASKELTPFSGVAAFLRGPTSSDCGATLRALSLRAVAEAIGKEAFNTIHSHEATKLYLPRYGFAIAHPSCLYTMPSYANVYCDDLSHITLGSFLYFQGIPWYGIKHPLGRGNGHWAVYLDNTSKGEKLYWALGFERLVTENELYDDLVRQYNDPQDDENRAFLYKFPSKEKYFAFMKDTHKARLRGYDKEMEQCYHHCDKKITMDEAKKGGLGFFGYALTEKITSATLKMIKETSLELWKDRSSLSILATAQIGHLMKQMMALHPSQLQSHKHTQQARNFESWVKG